MSQQMVLTGEGAKPAPVAQYERNTDAYEYISDRLNSLWSGFMNASRETQIELLRGATEYAVISVQTDVDAHEPAFLAVQDADNPSQEEIADILLDNVVQYHNNKARYITENREKVDFGGIVDKCVSGDIHGAHKQIVSECLGLGPAKGAFSLCMLGATELMCIDAHTALQAGLERDGGSGIGLEEYDTLQEKIYNMFPELQERVTPFVMQWSMFDANRESGIESHDPWFMWAGTQVDVLL